MIKKETEFVKLKAKLNAKRRIKQMKEDIQIRWERLEKKNSIMVRQDVICMRHLWS